MNLVTDSSISDVAQATSRLIKERMAGIRLKGIDDV
jgi:hypothetical protein